MPTSESQKLASKKWRENNQEKYNEICRNAVKKHYIENKEKISEYKRNWYQSRKSQLKDVCEAIETDEAIENK